MRACLLCLEGAAALFACASVCVCLVACLPLVRPAPRWQVSADWGWMGGSEWAAWGGGGGLLVGRLTARPSFQVGSWLWVPSSALPVDWELFCLGSLHRGQPAWPKGAPCAGLWVLADWSLWARHGWSLAFGGQPWVLPGRCVCVRIWVMCVCDLLSSRGWLLVSCRPRPRTPL